jgi:hypothetical protein
MSAGRRFVLDANVFIEAHQKYYAFDICPGFWPALVRQHAARRVFSIDKIKVELRAQNDALSEWAAETAPDTFFKGTADVEVANAYRQIVNWVQGQQQFTPEAKAEFAAAADGWVIAYAKANGLVVVTHEEFAPNARKRVLIPNVCLEFEVASCNTFEMLRELGERFILKKRQRSK